MSYTQRGHTRWVVSRNAISRAGVNVCPAILSGGDSIAREFAKQFYHSKEWLNVRQYVLMRDHYKCTRCNSPAQEVHHIIRLAPENITDPKITLNPKNLISLCKECHLAEHKEEKEEGKCRALGKTYGDCCEGFHFDENGMLVPDSSQAKCQSSSV